MTPINRSRRLQAGLAGLSVVSALGAALGLGLTTHTGTSQAQGTSGASGQRSARSDHGDDEESERHSEESEDQSGPVSPPTDSAPQASTGGS